MSLASIKKRWQDPRVKRVLGFLAAKGLLLAPNILPMAIVKLSVLDVIWVADNVEPRVWEVLPAALIHFPRTFLEKHLLPGKFLEVVKGIQHQNKMEGEFRGIQFSAMQHWANCSLKDRRVRPLSERRIPKNYRLKPEIIRQISRACSQSNISATQYLEALVERDSVTYS